LLYCGGAWPGLTLDATFGDYCDALQYQAVVGSARSPNPRPHPCRFDFVSRAAGFGAWLPGIAKLVVKPFVGVMNQPAIGR
jgi:hypothetical protein